jgi:hypothetical protein
MNTISRRSQRSLLALMLLAAIIALGACAVASPVEGPVSIRTLWQLDEAVELDEFRGFWTGVLLQETAEQPELAVTWSLDSQAFWPIWRIQVVARRDALGVGAGAGAQKEFSLWPGMESLTLTTVQPIPGHRYESCLSYDPDLGGLSVVITDMTAGSEIVADSVAVPVRQGAFHLATGLVAGGQRQEQASASVLQVEHGYVPWGVRWNVAVSESPHGAPLATFHVDRTDEAILDLSIPHPVRGEFDLLLVQGDRQLELGRVSLPASGSVAIPLQVADWPLGPVSVELRYWDRSEMTFCAQKSIVVGRLVTSFSPLELDEDRQSVQTTMYLSSQDEMADVPVVVEGRWTERVWDSVARRYRERLAADPLVLFAGPLSVAGPDSPGEVALSIPVPREPGFWRLQVVPAVESGVLVQAYPVQTQVFTYPPAQIASGEPYTIAVYPDVQYFSRSYPEILMRMNHWVAENAAQLGIGMLLQVGDITNDNNAEQWTRVQNSFRLLDGTVPYAFSLGNHDMATGGGNVAERGLSLVQRFFTPADFAGYRGAYPEGTLDNTYHEIRLGDDDYLVLALEFLPPDDVLAWADKVISAHPDHRVILVTHFYLNTVGNRAPAGRSAGYPLTQNPATTVNEGEEIWQKLLRRHENVFMVFSGHLSCTAVPRRVSRGDKGNRVYEFLVDYQSEPDGGSGWFALVHFTPDNKVLVDVYSPYLGVYKMDKDRYGFGNRFTIDLETGRISEPLDGSVNADLIPDDLAA